MRKYRIIILLFASFGICLPRGYAASLDEVYGPLLEEGRTLYRIEATQFGMSENGQHGNSSFGGFDASTDLFNLSQRLRFMVLDDLEAELGYGHFFPRKYRRSTYDGPTGALDTVQDHRLQYLQDYAVGLRYRKAPYEAVIRFNEKLQKSKSDSRLLLNNTTSFDDITAHYEDLSLGLRRLSQDGAVGDRSGFFDLTEPLLAKGQWSSELNVGFKNGRVENTSDIYVGSTLFIREYFHQLRPRIIPGIEWGYGLRDNLQFASGIAYTSPYKYNFEYRQINAGFPNEIIGTYSIENDLKLPLKWTYRPTDKVCVSLQSDIHYTKQRLDSWEKENNGTTTTYTTRKLRAFNTRPTLDLAFVTGEEGVPARDEFSQLTKSFLAHGQYLIRFKYAHDITTLRKSDNNGSLNVIDPDNLFLYPLDQIVSGTEYATFQVGNRTTRGAAVEPQNYYQMEASLATGLGDHLNVGMDVGYRSGNTLHHFTPQDQADRFYRFEPYYYFNWNADWKFKSENLLSFKLHYVPQYKTFLETTATNDTSQYEDDVHYYEASLAWQVLF